MTAQGAEGAGDPGTGNEGGGAGSGAGRAGGDRLLLVSLGGTIAMGAAGEHGVSHSLDAADLARAAGLEGGGATLDTLSLRAVPGSQLVAADVAELAGVIASSFAGGTTGVVVTQGTDTIEETSFLLELLGAADAGAVVVTGAMRNPTLPGTDGPANLAAALAVAAHPAARRLGVLVVMSDEVHAARFVTKSHTASTAAFTSYPGRLGLLSEGRPLLLARPLNDLPVRADQRARAREVLAAGNGPEVALVRTHLGDDGRLARRIGGLGYAGVVVEGTGGGHLTVPVADALGELAERLPVVLASRTGSGAVLRCTYAFSGGEVDLARRGLVAAGWLPGAKARLLLLVLAAAGAGRQDVAAAFAALG